MSHTPQHDQDLSPSDTPSTLLEFVRRFPTDESCATYLAQIRWPDGFVCPQCGSKKFNFLKTRDQYQCSAGHQTSVTAGTVMHRSKQSLTTWFYGAYLVSTLTPGISALQFQKQLGIKRYETAFNLLHKLRSSMVASDRTPLSGSVEVDEAYIGGVDRGGKRGRGTSKTLIVAAVETLEWTVPDRRDPSVGVARQRAGRVRLRVIPDAAAETLIPWVQANIAPGSLVSTDGHGGYNQLGDLGYGHRKVLQSHLGAPTGRYLPMVHLIISNLKRWLLGTHKGAVRPQHLQAYLNEYTFRFNRRFWRGPAFVRALGLATSAQDRPEYRTLYGTHPTKVWVHPNPRRNA